MSMVLGAIFCPIQAQTYKVGSGAAAQPPAQTGQKQSAAPALGWGSNIQNARLARSAQMALQRGDHAVAVAYAQRAAQAAPNDPQLWYLLGYAARLDGKYQLSADAYNRGIHLKSTPEGLSGLAQTYSMMGRTDEAKSLLKQVIAADPKMRDADLLLGDLNMRSGDYAEALKWLARAERLQPDARSELLLALSYQHLNQLDRASHYLDLAKRRAPDNPDVQRSLASYYREIGDYPQAIAALKSIRHPRPDVMAELGYTYQLDGKAADSARIYTQAANALPKDRGLQLSAAQAEVNVNAIKSANFFLQRAAAIDPNYYRLHAIRGEIAQLEERDEEAVREYTAALANLPATPVEGPLYGIQLHMDVQELARSLDEPELAQQQLQIAQTEINALHEHGPDRPTFLRLRALIKMNAGQVDSALSDMKQALAISPHDPNNLQLDGDLLMKLGRTSEAIAVYKQVLAIDPRSRFALTSMGYALRAAGNDRDAEKYFNLLAQYHPRLYVPYLALGDLYTARREFKKAQSSYSKGYAVAPKNALIVAGGMNAAMEAHRLPLAAVWLHRLSGKMENVPQVMREKERYFSFKGDYEQSAAIGEQAIKVLPRDREVVVYLGYDLLNLGRYDELRELTSKYSSTFPKDADLPLLSGYVDRHDGQLESALKDFSEALNRDPNVVTAYVNRGYVLNDLRRPREAVADFEAAIKREPKNGVAHLGLAYADLSLNRSHAAVQQSFLVEKEMGDSKLVHMIRATAYGREGLLTKAEEEYRSALKFTPNDGSLYFGLGRTLYAQRHYHEAIAELDKAQKLIPNDPSIYATLAHAYAHLHDREQTLKYVQLAEKTAQQNPAPVAKDIPGAAEAAQAAASAIYVETGEALSELGDQKEAMVRFRKALTTPNSNRVGVRLAIAQLMVQQGQTSSAERQIALAQMEAEAGDTPAVTGEQYIAAADLLQQMHEYRLSQTYLERARAAGAPDLSVRVAAANGYLALGDTTRAAAELAAVSQLDDSRSDYQFLLAQANVYQQEHQSTLALSSFAEAASAAGEDQSAQQSLLQAGANEGYRINQRLSLLSNLIIQPIFEDNTIYVLDSKLLGPTPVPPTDLALLPPRRSSLDTEWTDAYHLHFGKFPTVGGYFQLRNVRGVISVPAAKAIENRNTTDYSLNVAINPTIHFGRNVLQFDSGVQGTIRRDSLSPQALNQNLFRVFTYVTTSSFFNVLSVSGYGIWEGGPFTEINVHSKAYTGAVDFRIGQPWAKTALITGWGLNDQKFSVIGVEDYFTSSYIGLSRRFSDKFSAEAIVEDLRAFRVMAPNSGISQELRPAATVDFTPTPRWGVEAFSSYSDVRGFHVYDSTQNGISVSYATPFHRKFSGETGEVPLKYPIRFAAGFQQQTFFNFNLGKNQTFVPYVNITLF